MGARFLIGERPNEEKQWRESLIWRARSARSILQTANVSEVKHRPYCIVPERQANVPPPCGSSLHGALKGTDGIT
jgi:hypothetical protein